MRENIQPPVEDPSGFACAGRGVSLPAAGAVVPSTRVRVQLPTATDLALLLAQPQCAAPAQGGGADNAMGALPSPLPMWVNWVSHGQPSPLARNPLQHPQANRAIVLNGQAVAYHFAHGPRKTIGLRVDGKGLQVRAPRWVTQAQVHAVLRSKAGWILGKLQQQVQPAEVQAVGLGTGTRLSVLGRGLCLHGSQGLPDMATASGPDGVVSARLLSAAHWANEASGSGARARSQSDSDLQLHLGLFDGDPRWPQAVQAWVQGLAQHHFTDRLNHFAPQMGVQWQRLRISLAKTRWGSASSRGTICLHWRLMQLSPEVVDYVVVHELAHLREMNHSPRFWAVVQAALPDYERHRRTLKQVRLVTPA